jgi:hypothetical protein
LEQGVIVDSEVPALSRKKTQFLISSAEVGIFDIVAKIAGISVEKVRQRPFLLPRVRPG